MYLQHIFASAANLGLGVESSILIAIAALACLFGAEVAGICILIRKMNFARRDRMQQEFEEEYISRHAAEEDKHSYAAVALAFGAIPVATQIAFFVVAACAAIGAIVFAIVLIVFLAKGYALVSISPAKAPEAAADTEEVAQEQPEYAEIEDASEEQVQESYAFEEEIFEETFAEDVEEPVYEDEPAEEIVAEEDVEVLEEAAEPCAAPAVASAPVVGGIPVYSSVYPGGQIPYVEKYVSETYKEVIRETTTTTTTPAQSAEDRYSPATEEILKAIAELMKISSQIRASQEMAVENPVVKSDESVPAIADADAEEDDEEIEEIDAEEDDELDAEDAAHEDGEDGDEYESDLFSGNERIVGFDEETGCYIVAHYRKSFEAKLIQSRRSVKKYYSAIKNALLAYEGTKDRITWTINNYSNDRTQIAKINVRTRTLDLYLALDPATLEDSAYHGKDVGDKKKYAETPFLFKVNSPRKLTLALELVQRACEEQGLSPIDIETVNYEEEYPFDTTENLVSRGLIREYLREEKPAVTFELDPDHVPQVPEEDGSVIPVNANFTWEFDDEEPAQEETAEEVAQEEPATEPEIVSEPVSEPAFETTVTVETVAGTTTTTHETVRTTERHYTERYYGAPMQMTYQAQIAPNAQPMEALAEPAEESVQDSEDAIIEAVAEEIVVEEPIAEEAAEEAVEEIAEDAVEDDSEALVWDSLEEASDEEFAEEIAEDEEYAEEIAEDEEYAEEIAEDEEYAEEIAEDEEYAEEIVEDEEFAEEIAEDEEFEEEIAVDEEFEEEIAEDEEYAEEIAEDEEFEEESFEEEEEPEAPKPSMPKPASDSSVALLDVCVFDDYFESGATITLDALKEVGLASESAVTLKVYASGAVNGKFTVEANHFTLDAIKAIGDADGDSIMIR